MAKIHKNPHETKSLSCQRLCEKVETGNLPQAPLFSAYSIKVVHHEVEDLDKAAGLDLSQPQGALAEGQCGLGNDDNKQMGLVEGQ